MEAKRGTRQASNALRGMPRSTTKRKTIGHKYRPDEGASATRRARQRSTGEECSVHAALKEYRCLGSRSIGDECSATHGATGAELVEHTKAAETSQHRTARKTPQHSATKVYGDESSISVIISIIITISRTTGP